jgi:hypothetical protein
VSRNKERLRDVELERLLRKRDQEWEMAGLAQQDGDTAAAAKHTAAAKDYQRLVREYPKE